MNNKKICFIGYGNTIRTDDGIGPYVVEQLKKRLDGSDTDTDNANDNNENNANDNNENNANDSNENNANDSNENNANDSNINNNNFTFVILHQIDLAMAPTLAEYDEIIFIDAAIDIEEEFAIETVIPKKQTSAFATHLSSFPQLMDLAHVLYDASPIGRIVRVRGYDFEFGEELSKKGEQAAGCAIDAILAHIAHIDA